MVSEIYVSTQHIWNGYLLVKIFDIYLIWTFLSLLLCLNCHTSVIGEYSVSVLFTHIMSLSLLCFSHAVLLNIMKWNKYQPTSYFHCTMCTFVTLTHILGSIHLRNSWFIQRQILFGPARHSRSDNLGSVCSSFRFKLRDLNLQSSTYCLSLSYFSTLYLSLRTMSILLWKERA